jgi:glutathione synthase/RimK-type ligase-like ATP-grasp enzyme
MTTTILIPSGSVLVDVLIETNSLPDERKELTSRSILLVNSSILNAYSLPVNVLICVISYTLLYQIIYILNEFLNFSLKWTRKIIKEREMRDMKIYARNMPKHAFEELKKEFSHLTLLENEDRLLEIIKSEDKLIYFWDDKDMITRINQIDNVVFPTREMLDFSANREAMTKFVSEHSVFNAEREYIKFEGTFTVTVPKLNNSFNVVAKVGEEHQGQNKHLMYPGQQLMVRDSVIFEEFLDNAKSFRVLLVGDEVFVIEYFDDPNRPKTMKERWIKNLNAVLIENEDQGKFKKEIEDTLYLSEKLGFDYLGVDYIKNEEKTICLELNTFPGVKLNDRTKAAGLKYWRNVIQNI